MVSRTLQPENSWRLLTAQTKHSWLRHLSRHLLLPVDGGTRTLASPRDPRGRSQGFTPSCLLLCAHPVHPH